MTREQVISFSLITLLLFVAYQVYALLSPFLTAIFWAAILAFAFHPFYKRVQTTLRVGETAAALFFTVLIVLAVIPPMILLIFSIAQQTVDLYQWAVDYIRQGRLNNLILELRSLPLAQSLQERVPHWELVQNSISEWLLNSTHWLGNYTAAQAASLTKNTFFVVLNIFLMIILVFIFLKDGQKIYEFLRTITPLEAGNKNLIFGQINETFAAVIRGQLLTSVVQSSAAGLVFWFLGIPVPLLFAILTFLLSMIPVAGAATVWVPLVIYLFFQHAYWKAAILFAFGVLFISLVDNFLKPAIIGDKLKLPYFLLFFGMMGGIKVYGLMGIFLTPVVLSLFFALIRIYREKYLLEKT